MGKTQILNLNDQIKYVLNQILVANEAGDIKGLTELVAKYSSLSAKQNEIYRQLIFKIKNAEKESNYRKCLSIVR